MENVMQVISKRISVRTYDNSKPVEPEALNRMQELVHNSHTGPFGNPVRFRLLYLGELSRRELRRLGTYGFIQGASYYLLGAVPDREGNMEDLGYCMEKIILEATALNLGTCWLAGTFRRSSFARQICLNQGELLPAVTPVGYPDSQKSLLERMMKAGAGSRRRKSWEQLFFNNDEQTPLTEEDAGVYRDALEAVRLAPSAANRQPWRFLKKGEGEFYLYLKENLLFNRAMGKIRTQNIDMGIAMCHFELVAKEKGLNGVWKKDTVEPTATKAGGEVPEKIDTDTATETGVPSLPGCSYIVGWKEF